MPCSSRPPTDTRTAPHRPPAALPAPGPVLHRPLPPCRPMEPAARHCPAAARGDDGKESDGAGQDAAGL